jgi:hypothetical protein
MVLLLLLVCVFWFFIIFGNGIVLWFLICGSAIAGVEVKGVIGAVAIYFFLEELKKDALGFS